MSALRRLVDGRRRIWIAGFVAGGLAFGAFAAFAQQSPPPLSVAITASGVLEPARDMSLDFSTQGRLVHVYVQQGETVSAGQPLAQIDSVSAEAALKAALSDLAAAKVRARQATLSADQAREAVKAGQANATENAHARRAAVEAADATVSSAQTALAQTTQAWQAAAETVAALQAQIAPVQQQVDQADEQRSSDEATLTVLQTQLQAAQSRLQNDQSDLQSAQQQKNDDCSTTPPSSSCSSSTAAANDAQARVTSDRAAVAAIYARIEAVQNDLGGASYTATKAGNVLARLKAQLSDAAGDLAEAKATRAAADTKLETAKAAAQAARDAERTGNQADAQALATAKDASAQALAGTGTSESAPAEAVTAAAARVAAARADLAATTLRAPAAGTIASVNGAVGDIVGGGGGGGQGADAQAAAVSAAVDAASGGGPTPSAGGAATSPDASSGTAGDSAAPSAAGGASATSALIRLVDLQQYEAVVYVQESDVAYVRLGEAVRLHARAVGVTLSAHVESVDSSPTFQGRQPFYAVHIRLDGNDPALRPGMSVDGTIQLHQ